MHGSQLIFPHTADTFVAVNMEGRKNQIYRERERGIFSSLPRCLAGLVVVQPGKEMTTFTALDP